MRIVQVVHGLPPQERAGVEILTLELSRALQARGHQVTIITRTFAPEREEFSLQEEQDEHGLRIIRIVNNYTRTSSFRLHYDNPFFHDAFRRLLDRCGADIVHFQHVQHLSASLIPGVSSLGYPTVLGLHDFFFACHLVQFINSADQLCPGPQQGERCVACLHDVASAEAVRHRFMFMTRVLQVPQRVIVPSAFLAQRIAAVCQHAGLQVTYTNRADTPFALAPLSFSPEVETGQNQAGPQRGWLKDKARAAYFRFLRLLRITPYADLVAVEDRLCQRMYTQREAVTAWAEKMREAIHWMWDWPDNVVIVCRKTKV